MANGMTRKASRNCHSLATKQPAHNESYWGKHLNKLLSRVNRPYPKTQLPESLSNLQKRRLGCSIAIFQAGEAGEGRLAREINGFKTPYIDETYREACRLFVAEEGRHGRILADMLKELDTTRKRDSRTEHLFIHARRLAGIRIKLLVLLLAELVGFSYYSALVNLLDECPAKTALSEIRNDEHDHLRFHLDFFRCMSRHSGIAGALGAVLCLVIGLSSFALVAAEHRAALACMGGNAWGFALEGWRRVVSLSLLILPISSTHSMAGEKWLESIQTSNTNS